jgi:hypothetical protein
MFRTSILILLSSIAMLFVTGGRAYAQQRPGIRTFVTPPNGCYVVDPVDTESTHSFIKAEIQALSLANEGAKANREVLTATGRPLVDEMAKVITGLRRERIEDTCASFVISPYTGSKNVSTATAAKVLVLAYDDLGNMTDEMLRIALQSTVRRRVGESTRTLPQLRSKRLEILGQIGEVVNLSLLQLIDESRTDLQGKPDHLILTKAQQDELLDYLHSQFPTLKIKQTDMPTGDFVKQAALIESFLAGKYKPADR